MTITASCFYPYVLNHAKLSLLCSVALYPGSRCNSCIDFFPLCTALTVSHVLCDLPSIVWRLTPISPLFSLFVLFLCPSLTPSGHPLSLLFSRHAPVPSLTPAGDPRHLPQDKPHKHLMWLPKHPRHRPCPSSSPLLAMALLSWSLLSADTEVFDPLDPQFPARWRCPYIYVQYGTCLVVYVYVRLLLACGPGLL